MGTVHMSKFVARQVKESRFSHWEFPDLTLLDLVVRNFAQRKPGYRDGVVLVPVPPEGFFTSIVTLKEGDRLRGGYESRFPGEDPRKFVYLESDVEGRRGKQPAVAVDIVLYRKDVLDEDGDWDNQPVSLSSDAIEGEWAVISVNARPCVEDLPIEPEVLIFNHFHLSGGTRTMMTDAEFVEALRASVMAWKDKAVVGP